MEYAQEAVKQGSVVVGLVNKTHSVLVGLKVRILDLSILPHHRQIESRDQAKETKGNNC